jgi:hypothetical protein
MNLRELESKYQPHLRRVGGLLLLPAEQAVNLLEDAKAARVQLRGVEAFRIFDDGGIQPSLEFSNTCYGTVSPDGEFRPNLRRRQPWNTDPQLIDHTQELIRQGAANGYGWYEVSLEDVSTECLLFFRDDDLR